MEAAVLQIETEEGKEYRDYRKFKAAFRCLVKNIKKPPDAIYQYRRQCVR